MKLMWRYTMRYKKLLFFDFLGVFGFILIELGLPTLLAQMIDRGVLTNDTAFIKRQGLLMIAITVVGIALNIMLAYFSNRITSNMIRDIRNDLFAKIQTFSHENYETLGVSSLITRTTNDAYQIMVFLNMILRMGFLTPLMFLASLYLVMRTSPSLSLAIFLALPLLLLGVILIGRISEPLSEKQQKNLDKINMILRENLSGLRVIRAFVNENHEEERFAKVNKDYTDSSKSLFKLMITAQPAFFFLFNIVMIFVIWFGALQINSGSLRVGDLIAFIEYIFHALFSFMLFASVFMSFPRANVSALRIEEAFETLPSITDGPAKSDPAKTSGKVQFEHVSFAYPGHAESPVIRDVDFEAHRGQTIAFIGSTGSGKSTLIRLIPRFFDATKGRVLVDEVDVKEYHLRDLRRKIGFIPQKATLFSGTIADNLRYGKADATLAEMEKVCETAQALDFINEKPKRFDEEISEGGTNFSGGQKQRLAIARALIRKPEIYIFDDSFSALDFKMDAALRKRLKEETKEALVMIVAQRVSTIMDADSIVVLEEGRVVQQGTHRELLKNCEIYREIATSQLSEEELNR